MKKNNVLLQLIVLLTSWKTLNTSKSKKVIFLVLISLLAVNLFAIEDRSQNFECKNIFGFDKEIKVNQILLITNV